MDPITVIAEHNKYYVLMMNQGLELNVENLMKVMDPDVESVLAKSIYRHPGVARWWRAFQCLDDLKKRSTIVRSKWTRQEVNLLEVYLAARSVYELLDGMSMPGE